MGLLDGLVILILIILLSVIVYVIIKAQELKVITGQEELIGSKGIAVSNIDKNKGKIFTKGEYWNAISNKKIPKGKKVVIIDILDDMVLKVKEEE